MESGEGKNRWKEKSYLLYISGVSGLFVNQTIYIIRIKLLFIPFDLLRCIS